MSRKGYSEEIRQAAKTLHIEGLSSREIRERLAADTAGVGYPVEPGERTIDLWRREWRREGISAGFAVREGGEQAAEDATYRRLLALYRETLDRFEQTIREGKPDAGIATTIERLQRTVDAAKYRRRMGIREVKATEPGPETAGTGTGSMLRLLAQQETETANRE